MCVLGCASSWAPGLCTPVTWPPSCGSRGKWQHCGLLPSKGSSVGARNCWVPAPGEGTGVEGKPCCAQAMLSGAAGPSGRSMKVLRATRRSRLGLSSSLHLTMLGACGWDHAQRDKTASRFSMLGSRVGHLQLQGHDSSQLLAWKLNPLRLS